MDDFHIRQGEWYCEQVPVSRLAKTYGTPLYVYSQNTILSHFFKIMHAFAAANPLICYSVKANSNLSILRLLAAQGAGLDIVSQGELIRGLEAGVTPERIVYAGVGKTETEIAAALRAGILMFNVESEPEARLLNQVAQRLRKTARVALRINPDVDAKTHQYITTGKKESKFGLSIPLAMGLFRAIRRMRHLKAVGVHMHIGSQITSSTPYIQAIQRLRKVVEDLRRAGFDIAYFNLGGGLGIIYNEERPQTADAFAQAVLPLITPLQCRLILEPGRFIVGNAGILITQVQYVKRGHVKSFAVVDAGMNDLIRPSLYNAYHQIVPVQGRPGRNTVLTDVVGPICESGDFLGHDRHLPKLNSGDLLAVRSAGAYGMAMASNYNSRVRAAEVMVSGARVRLIRRRETYADLLAPEKEAALK
ncbi:diaminopimelate decarboxylase [candidate division FCPU426 bacterium]|nr:diaminopimelate decarboxylase [candidate division FCPU426 bacterium]